MAPDYRTGIGDLNSRRKATWRRSFTLGLRYGEDRDHANGRVPIFLRMHRLRRASAAKTGRLLRVLFMRISSMPVNPADWYQGFPQTLLQLAQPDGFTSPVGGPAAAPARRL